MNIVSYSDLAESRWINGGGTVKVIASGAVASDGTVSIAGGDRWDWRLSIADVGQPGDFSPLPGVGRILTVVDGGPLHLTINGKSRLAAPYQPLAFDGGIHTRAALPKGPVRNLNLMCRRGHAGGSVSVIPLQEHVLLPHQAAVLLEGEAFAGGNKLHSLDTVFGSRNEKVLLRGTGTMALVGLYGALSR